MDGGEIDGGVAGQVKVTVEKGLGIRKRSQDVELPARGRGARSRVPIQVAPTSSASCTGPGLATMLGPRGPSAVKAVRWPAL